MHKEIKLSWHRVNLRHKRQSIILLIYIIDEGTKVRIIKLKNIKYQNKALIKYSRFYPCIYIFFNKRTIIS